MPATIGTATQNFVDQVYRDVLHRVADPSGLAGWTNAIDSGQLDRTEFALAIQASLEGRLTLVNDLYLCYLDRAADPAGQQFWADFLADGNTTAELKAELLGSQEYFLKAGGTNEGFVTALYQDVLCRAPDPGGLAGWVQALNSGTSRTDVAEAFVESDEGRDVQVRLSYQEYLRRDPDQGGLDFWSEQLRDDDLEDAIDTDDFDGDDEDVENFEDNTDAVFAAFLFGSQEYFQGASTFTDFADFPCCANELI